MEKGFRKEGLREFLRIKKKKNDTRANLKISVILGLYLTVFKNWYYALSCVCRRQVLTSLNSQSGPKKAVLGLRFTNHQKKEGPFNAELVNI